MEKISKKRAAEIAGISIYRLNKDIDNGVLKLKANGGVCPQSLQRVYQAEESVAEQVPAQDAEVVSALPGQLLEPSAEQPVSKPLERPEVPSGDSSTEVPTQMRLIGKLESLLSLAERHRLMIEQQRRNIALLKDINLRQQREIQILRDLSQRAERSEPQPWRRFIARISRMHGV